MFDENYYGTQEALPYNKDMPDFCHKCGRCCRSATTFYPHSKVLELAANGEKQAVDFLEVFIPYESIEAARAVVPEQVDQVMKVVKARNDMDENDITFYHCPHVTEEGLCGIYERRPDCCKDAPGNGWSVMPPGCGFEGWQFQEREKQKRMVRDLKSSRYMMEQLSPDGIHHPARPGTTLKELRETLDIKIKPWGRYGADKW
jgi:Fe-S-cluster containining protein